jgi:MraZ protein
MFRGRYTHAIDEKGRVSIPSKYRETLNGRGQQVLMLTNGLDPCIAAFPMDLWFEEEEKVKKYPIYDEQLMQFKRFYLSGAQECQIDRQGRILIPPSLREYAGLDREAVFVSLVDNFEIWSPERWNPVFDPKSVRKTMAKRDEKEKTAASSISHQRWALE